MQSGAPHVAPHAGRDAPRGQVHHMQSGAPHAVRCIMQSAVAHAVRGAKRSQVNHMQSGVLHAGRNTSWDHDAFRGNRVRDTSCSQRYCSSAHAVRDPPVCTVFWILGVRITIKKQYETKGGKKATYFIFKVLFFSNCKF
jgi:hypothetical protein